MPGGVRFQGGMRDRSAAASRIEQDDPVEVRVEELSLHRGAPCPGPAVEEQNGCALRVPGGLPANTVAVTDIEHSFRMRVDRRVENGFEVRMRGLLWDERMTLECERTCGQTSPFSPAVGTESRLSTGRTR